jgi:hypothetical protein
MQHCKSLVLQTPKPCTNLVSKITPWVVARLAGDVFASRPNGKNDKQSFQNIEVLFKHDWRHPMSRPIEIKDSCDPTHPASKPLKIVKCYKKNSFF